MARKKRHITAEDLYRFEISSGSQISPDGKHVVFSVQRVDEEKQKKYSNLWIAPTGGGKAYQFTYGDQVDAAPKWSPDGSQIAFLSNRKDEKQSQIYIIPFAGGEARPLTDLKGVFANFEWSPDGAQFVCQFRKKDKDAIEREEDEKKKKLGIVSRHIKRVFYMMDGEGYLPQERWHLWTIDAKNGKATQLTDHGIYDEHEPAWSPDGKYIAFLSNRSQNPDFDIENVDLLIIPTEGGEFRKIDTFIGDKGQPAFSPDGKWIAFYGKEGRGEWWKLNNLWIVPFDGNEKPKNLTADYDFNVDCWTIGDMGSAAMMPPTWSKDGQALYFQSVQHGNTLLKSVDVDNGNIETVIDGPGVVAFFTFDEDQTKLAYNQANMSDIGQVWLHNFKTEKSRKLTHINNSMLQAIDLGEIEEVWYKGGADNDLQGWILKPPNFDPNKKYPSILEIHGGPMVQYGQVFMHEFYFLAANGYVVYFTNPRGGRGYGEAHAQAIDNDWGGADYDDLMKFTDLIVQKPYIDPERLGVTGGSYGGYMTNWIIGHTDRFKAAVTQRSVSNLISMWGSSDFNWAFQKEFGDAPPWEAFDNFWRQSPMKYIGNAKTPTLVIHSEQDLRCSIEQGQQVFVALKKLGVDTEFVVFPDEPHGLSRAGRTDRRIARLNHILRWFDKYLKDNQ